MLEKLRQNKSENEFAKEVCGVNIANLTWQKRQEAATRIQAVWRGFRVRQSGKVKAPEKKNVNTPRKVASTPRNSPSRKGTPKSSPRDKTTTPRNSTPRGLDSSRKSNPGTPKSSPRGKQSPRVIPLDVAGKSSSLKSARPKSAKPAKQPSEDELDFDLDELESNPGTFR